MCGIFGVISKRELVNKDYETYEVLKESSSHRGPDSTGSFSNSKIIFGMNRLSIVAVENGTQPIWNDENKIGIVGNGEIDRKSTRLNSSH